MDSSEDELAAATPPLKRRRMHDEDALRPSRSPDRAPGGDAASPRSSSNEPPNGDAYAARSRFASPPSRSRPAFRPRRAPGRSPSSSGSSARSESRPQSRSPSRCRSSSSPSGASRSRRGHPRRRSRSCSSDRSRSDSYSPRAPQPTPPREPLRPNYRPRLVLHGHTKAVSQVRVSPDGRFIASASADATLKIWDAATGAHMDTLVGHMAGVSCLAWTPDSKTLASGSDDKVIRLWDRVTGRPKTAAGRKSSSRHDVSALRGHHSYIHCLAFSPKGNILASGSYDEAVFLWDVRAGRLMRSLPAHSDPVSGIDFCRDGTLVVSCSTDGLIRVWDTSTGQCLRTLVHEDNPAVTNVCFSPNGRFVLAFSLDNCIRLWDYVAGTVKKTYQGHRNDKFAVGGCFAVLAGCPLIAAASEDGDVLLWDVKSKDVLQRVRGHGGVCFWVDVHGETMVSAGEDKTVRVYRHVGDVGAANGTAGSENLIEGALRSELPIRQEDV